MDVTDQKALRREWIRQPVFDLIRYKLILLFRIGRLDIRKAEHGNTISENELSGSRTNTVEHFPS
jgi:hypothetical protein